MFFRIHVTSVHRTSRRERGGHWREEERPPERGNPLLFLYCAYNDAVRGEATRAGGREALGDPHQIPQLSPRDRPSKARGEEAGSVMCVASRSEETPSFTFPRAYTVSV